MARFCPCGKAISNKRWLCAGCGSIYGYTAADWPDWLRLIVNDNNREELAFKRHETLDYETDIEPNGRGGYRAKPVFALRGCRTETHLYQERDQHGG
jgi:hypothetical protein